MLNSKKMFYDVGALLRVCEFVFLTLPLPGAKCPRGRENENFRGMQLLEPACGYGLLSLSAGHLVGKIDGASRRTDGRSSCEILGPSSSGQLRPALLNLGLFKWFSIYQVSGEISSLTSFLVFCTLADHGFVTYNVWVTSFCFSGSLSIVNMLLYHKFD